MPAVVSMEVRNWIESNSRDGKAVHEDCAREHA